MDELWRRRKEDALFVAMEDDFALQAIVRFSIVLFPRSLSLSLDPATEIKV
jgi:hypothetical protein